MICCGSEEIARHRRSYEREELIFDPLHYLALLERKTNALDQAAALAGWELPEQFTCLRRLLEARLGKPGKREYVQVLRLLEDFRFEHVAAAVRQACELGAIGLDAVRHLVLCRIEQRPPRLDLTKYPHLGSPGGANLRCLFGTAGTRRGVMARSKLLLEAHLKALRLPTFLREYDKLARQCAAESLDSRSFLQQLCELELLDREQRATERRIKAAKFPVKSLDTFDFPSLPALNKKLVLETGAL